jgi:AcrR family transcriptional regulator
MRGLTAALGVQAPALYRRIGSKEALLALVLDHVMGDLAPPDDGPWQGPARRADAPPARALRAQAAAGDAVRLQHPARPECAALHRGRVRAAAPRRVLRGADGFAITTLTTYVIGFTFLAAGRSSGPVHTSDPGDPAPRTPRRRRGIGLAVLEHTHRGDADRVFEFGLRHLIAGLATDFEDFSTAEAQRRGEIRASPRLCVSAVRISD